MAKILLLHPNFPAQFKNIAKDFSNQGNEVKFLCQTHFNRSIKGVERLCLKGSLGEAEHKNYSLEEKTIKIANQYKSAFEQLKKGGYNPEIIISHSGWGCGYYARAIWPKARIISYLEWWFDLESDLFTYDVNNSNLPFNNKNVDKYWSRNSFIAMELINSDEIVAPSEWQKSQLPKLIRDKCRVIFDGLSFQNNFKTKKSSKIPTITYGTRGMEPVRGFPQFIKAITNILSEDSNIEVQIAGEDKIAYGGKLPKQKSWKKWAIDYMSKNNVDGCVKWLGYLESKKYKEWLLNSDCHVYLTHPFVISWSLMDAISANCKIVASDI